MNNPFKSKTRTIHRSDRQIFELLSDFSVFSALVPEDKVREWEASPDHCSFQVDGIGKVALRVVERQPFSLIRASIETSYAENVFLQLNLHSTAPYETVVSLELQADINPMVRMMVAGKVQEFLDKLVDAMAAA